MRRGQRLEFKNIDTGRSDAIAIHDCFSARRSIVAAMVILTLRGAMCADEGQVVGINKTMPGTMPG